MKMDNRSLSDEEMNLIVCFAEQLDDVKRAQLLEDAANATVKVVAADESRLIFNINGYRRPPYAGQHLFGVEGRMLDSDNSELSVCLYADENGRLLELELIRWDSHELLGPRWNTLRIY